MRRNLVQLTENCRDCEIRSIRFQVRYLGSIVMLEDWFDGEPSLEVFESPLLSFGPYKRRFLFDEIRERLRELGVVLNELAVEVGEP